MRSRTASGPNCKQMDRKNSKKINNRQAGGPDIRPRNVLKTNAIYFVDQSANFIVARAHFLCGPHFVCVEKLSAAK